MNESLSQIGYSPAFEVNKDIQDPSHQDTSRFTIINNFNSIFH